MKNVFCVMLFLACISLAEAHASAAAIECKNCSEAQMEGKALQWGAGTWMIWNPVNGDVRKYKVTCGVQPNFVEHGQDAKPLMGERDPTSTNGSCSNLVANWLSVSQEVMETAANLSEVYVSTSGTYKAQVVVQAEHFPLYGTGYHSITAHDYILDANLRASVNDWLNQDALNQTQSYLGAVLTYLMAHADAALGFTGALEVLVAVEFVDGSKLRVKLTLNNSPDYEEGSARDSEGNLLPDTAGLESQGRWRFQLLGNLDRWTNMMRGLGARVHRSGASDIFKFWICEFDGEVLTCTASTVYTP